MARAADFKFSVVMPIYNSEGYLKEAVDSVICQSIGFEDNVQLIMVNDGSTDASGAICRQYEAEHPDNIVYIEKENGGVSSARNAGIEHVRGKYVIFLDGDDIWEADAFRRIYDFFETHKGEFNVCSCRIMFIGDYEGREHPLDYKFVNGQHVADLIEEPDMVSSTIGSVAIRASAIGDLRFNERISSGEDALFVNSLLLDFSYLGILPEARFYYRRNNKSGSGSSSATSKPSWYTEVPREYYLGLCERSMSLHGEVLPFIQYVIMYDLRWRSFKPIVFSILSDNERQQYLNTIKESLRHISDSVIRKARGYNQYRRLYFLMLKNGANIIQEAKLNNGVLKRRKTRLFNYSAKGVARITTVDFEEGKFVLCGYIRVKGIAADYSLFARDDRGNVANAELQDYPEGDVKGLIGESVAHAESFRIAMPLKRSERVKLILRIEDGEIDIRPTFDKYLRIKDRADAGCAWYSLRADYVIKVNKGEISIEKEGFFSRRRAESEWKNSITEETEEEMIEMHGHELKLHRIISSTKIGEKVVFVSPRANDVLRDNMRMVYDNIELPKEFIAKMDYRKDPNLYERVAEAVCSAKVIVTDDYFFPCMDWRKKQGQHLVQLWHACGAFKYFGKDAHGMIPDRDRLFHRDYDLVTVSAEGIRQIYADCFQIPVEKVKATGVARTDKIFDAEYKRAVAERVYSSRPELNNREIILYAPTFRDLPGIKRSLFTPELNFRKLSASLKENQVFALCPHPLMTEPIITESLDNVIEIRDVNTADMMFVADLLVTDYSSVIFEFALMGKPMAFYCYDYDTYDRDFYLDMDSELPGPLLRSQGELEGLLHKETWEISGDYKRFLNKYMGACDGHSTERISSMIIDLYRG